MGKEYILNIRFKIICVLFVFTILSGVLGGCRRQIVGPIQSPTIGSWDYKFFKWAFPFFCDQFCDQYIGQLLGSHWTFEKI